VASTLWSPMPGAAWTGAIAELAAAELRGSFELNFFAIPTVAQAAVAIFPRPGFGGQLPVQQ